MKWSKDKPTESGYYWVRGPMFLTKIEHIEIIDGNGHEDFGPHIFMAYEGMYFTTKKLGIEEYYGPLKEPK